MGFAEIFFLMVSLTSLFVYLLVISDVEFNSLKVYDSAGPFYHLQNDRLSAFTLGLLRLAIALFIWSSILYILADREGLRLKILNGKGEFQPVHVKHLGRLSMFTVWCWTLQGFYFAVAAAISFAFSCDFDIKDVLGHQGGQILLFTAWVSFEVAFAVAFLVTAVVTFVLIPGNLKRGMSVDLFFEFLPLVMHNANVVFIALEFLLNRLTFNINHFPFVPLFGAAYVLFSWYWYKYQIGVFYYFFLDYNNKDALLWHIGLLFVLSLFFLLGYALSKIRDSHYNWTVVITVILTFSITKVFNTYSTKIISKAKEED